MGEYFALAMFPAILFALFVGFPVALSLMGVALGFGLITFGPSVIFQFAEKVDSVASNFVLAAVPLFVFMGSMLERSGVAERLFEAVHLWTRRLPGGLAVGTIVMCVIFAASTGVIGATETVVGLLAIPIMMKYAYHKGLISGTICAGGSLGTIIPPSVVVVVLGPVADVSVGDLFVGMLFPGLLMANLYILYIVFRCIVRPADGARIPPSPDDPALSEKLLISSKALLPPLLLIFAVFRFDYVWLGSTDRSCRYGSIRRDNSDIVLRPVQLVSIAGSTSQDSKSYLYDYADFAGWEHVFRSFYCFWRGGAGSANH